MEVREVLEVLSEETRWTIVNVLALSSEPLTLSEIAGRTSKDKRTVDKHLKILMRAGLVERSVGENNVYVYRPTVRAVMLLEAAEKIVSGSSYTVPEADEASGAGIVARRAWSLASLVPGVIFIVLGLLVGYGGAIGIMPPGNEGAKLIVMLVFIVVGTILIGVSRKWEGWRESR